MSLRITVMGFLTLAVVGWTRAAAQEPADPGGQDRAADSAMVDWAVYPGLYAFPDGERMVVMDLVDQMPAGRHQLVLMEERSGRARTLYPAGRDRFEFGPGWFVPEPVEGTVRFDGRVDGRSAAVTVGPDSAADGAPERGERVPVRTVPVEVPSAGVTLAGELLLPPVGVGEAPYPVVQFLNGGGPLTRRSPRQMGLLFAARGVAALVMDKRGTGESGGQFAGTSLADFGGDAVAVNAFLRARPEVDPDRIGVYAGSEGGLVAWYLFRETPAPALFVCRVCPIRPWGELVTATQRSRLEAEGLPGHEIEEAVRFLEAQARYALTRDGYAVLDSLHQESADSEWAETLGMGGRLAPPDGPGWDWYRDFLRPDPREIYRELDAPIMVLLGGEDARVPAALNAPLARRILAGRDVAHVVRVVDRGSHGLLVPVDTTASQPGPRRGYPPGLLTDIAGWVAEQMGADSAP